MKDTEAGSLSSPHPNIAMSEEKLAQSNRRQGLGEVVGWAMSLEGDLDGVMSSCCLVTKSCLTLCNLWTVAHQAPLSMGCPRQEYWSGLPFPSLGHLPNPWIKLVSPALAGGSFATEQPGEPQIQLSRVL